jgi:hypothetical protein
MPFARIASEGLDILSQEAREAGTTGSFRTVWIHIKELGEAIRTAPSLTGSERAPLQRRLNDIVRDVRKAQRHLQHESQAAQAPIYERLHLICDALAEAQSVSDIQELRADLMLVREHIAALDTTVPRLFQSRLWAAWQAQNQAAWQHLSILWAANENSLTELLDRAEQDLRTGRVAQARATIKSFHDALNTHPCSNSAARALRERARTLWKEAVELGRQRHQHYLHSVQRRVEAWQRDIRQNEHKRNQLEAEILQQERYVAMATTDVGYALAVGRLTEMRRSLARLRIEDRKLTQRIEEASALLSTPSTSVE